MIHQNTEAEAALLCDFIIDKAVVERLISAVHVSDFSIPLHQELFVEMSRLHHEKTDIDEKTLIEQFRKRGHINRVADIMGIASTTASSANVDYYLEIVKSLSAKRSIERAIDTAKARLQDVASDGAVIAGDLEREVKEITLGSLTGDYRPAKNYLPELCDYLQRCIDNKGAIKGVDNPFHAVNEIAGFRDGEYTIIAARPSMGKTAFALNMIKFISMHQNIKTGFFSMEMSVRQLNLRLISDITKFSVWSLEKGMVTNPNHLNRVYAAMSEIGDGGLLIDETPNIKIQDLKTKARRMVHVDGVKIIFVDYIGLIDDCQPRIPRHEQIADISRNMKNLAKELDIPIVVLSQLTRDSEGNKPTLASLAETRSLEQDADVVMFIHRERAEKDEPIPAKIIVAKNRNGPVGTADLIFNPKLARFENCKLSTEQREAM